MTSVGSCAHSLLKCGECRAEEPKHVSTIAELEARIVQYKAELSEARALDATRAQNATPPPVGGILPNGEHNPVVCAKVQDFCIAPACVEERRKNAEAAKPVKLDLGCGKNKKEGFVGADCLDFPGVDVKLDIGKDRWPWNDSSVDEVNCSHTVEHLRFNPEYPERIHFANELWRVLKPGAKATIVVPHWASCRHYGDYTHREPVCEMWPWYLNKAWRASDAPHNTLYACDFDCTTPGYSWHSALNHRNDEYRQYAMHWFKEAAQDMVFTLLCRK